MHSGYYPRTCADADTVKALKADNSRLCMALVSGAQVISTDYYVPDTRFAGGYVVKLAARWLSLLLPLEGPFYWP